MADLVRYVRTDSSSGGDGTEDRTDGATRAYVSLSAAEAAEQANLVSDGNTIEFKCSVGAGSAADTSSASVFAGWTTDATHTITINPNASDVNATGIYDTSIYRIETTSNYATNIRLAAGADHATIKGIQSFIQGTTAIGIRANEQNSGGKVVIIENIIKGDTTGTNQRGILWGLAGSDYTIANNLVYDCAGSGILNSNYMTTGDQIIYNNTVDNCVSGINTGSGNATTTRIFNNLLTNNTTDYAISNTPDATDNNVTSDATGPDSGHTSKTITYTDSGNGDYSTNDADVVDLGTDLSADSEYAVTVDLLGVSRSATPTIGAIEYVAVAVGGYPIINLYYRTLLSGV